MKRALIALLVPVLLAFGSAAFAGPIIISGTDADDHGFFNVTNQSGWLYMQSAFDNVGAQVTNGNKLAVCIGCNTGQAQNAFASAFDLSTLPGAGWTRTTLTSVADITNFMTNASGTMISQAGIVYMPTASGNVSGGITPTQLGPVNANAAALNAYVAAGGGLFTQDQNPANSGGVGYGWLTTLLPGIVVHGDNDFGTFNFNSGSLTRTAAGIAAFPGISDALLSGATPWHDWFSGDFGGLSVLVTGPITSGPGAPFAGAVVLGGGAGTVIQCGQPGQPACAAPGPATLFLLGSGLIGLAALRRWR